MSLLNTFLFIASFGALITTARAQSTVRKSYPDPVRTPEVERIMNERIPWAHKGTRAENNAAETVLPEFVDNSTSIYFPPIINQTGGSCAQAAGIGYMFTYEMNRLLHRDANLSADNRFSYLFTWNLLNGGIDQGGFVEEGLNITRLYGAMTEADYGTSSWFGFKWVSGYEKYFKALQYRTTSIYSFKNNNEDGIRLIKEYLYNKGVEGAPGGILTFSTYSTGWTIDENYAGPSHTDYHTLITRLAVDGAHAMTIVGYDDLVESYDESGTKHQGAFIVVNSWGKSWADNGRIYLPYHFFTHRNGHTSDNYLGTTMTGIEVGIHNPLVVFKIRLSYTSRDDLAFVMGASADYHAAQPAVRANDYVFSHQGGDHHLLGAYTTKGSFEFALDYTRQLTQSDGLPSTYPLYFLNIARTHAGKKYGEGTVESVSIIDYTDSAHPREYFCREAEGSTLPSSNNWFKIPARYWGRWSCHPVRWQSIADTPSPQTFIIRTANGRYAKLKFTNYDATTGRLTFDYTLQNDGSRIFAH